MTRMMFAKPTIAITAISLAFLVLTGVTVTAATNGTGIQYNYTQSNKQVTLTTSGLDLRVTTGGNVPHFMFWDPNITDPNTRLTYHVQFYQLIEFNDTNGDATYTPGVDSVASPILGLGSVQWDFSGFATEEEAGSTTAVHFNFTLQEVQHSGYDALYMQLRCHINATHPDQLKFDIVISGWPWTHNDSYLALRWDLMIQTPGTHTYQHANQYHYENRVYAFDGAFFSYRHSANAGNDTIQVTSNYDEQPEKTQFYLCYPHFGTDLMEHDPVLGLTAQTTTSLLDSLPLLLVVGAGALACVAIAAAIWMRRR